MKLTWITSRHPPDDGGMACSSDRLVTNLREREHTVNVIHLSTKPAQTLNAAQRRVSGNVVLDNWNRVLRSGLNVPRSPEQIFWTCRSTLAESILIGFGGDHPGYLAVLWAKWLNLKSVALFRGNDFERLIHDSKRAWLTHFVLQEADMVGAVSQEMTRRISTLRSGRTVYTPNSIDTSAWTFFPQDHERAKAWRAKHLPEDRAVIGMIGQLKVKKGLDLAVTLLNSAAFRERAHLLTVGTVPDALRQTSEVECSATWTRVPFQRRERLPMFYAVADILFIPSLYDGMPNVLLEAMSLGKTVVASRAGGLPDVIVHGENGFLFDIDDPASVIEVLDRALALSSAERDAIGTRARATVESHFRPDQEVQRLEAVLRDLTEGA